MSPIVAARGYSNRDIAATADYSEFHDSSLWWLDWIKTDVDVTQCHAEHVSEHMELGITIWWFSNLPRPVWCRRCWRMLLLQLASPRKIWLHNWRCSWELAVLLGFAAFRCVKKVGCEILIYLAFDREMRSGRDAYLCSFWKSVGSE